MKYETLKVTMEGESVRVALSRPEVKNAFNDELIAELTSALRDLADKGSVRVLTLTGEGNVFSAGADLNWMKKTAGYSHEENLADARRLADLLETLYTFPGATIAMVNCAAIGGGVGLVAACDVAVASRAAVFSLSEVRLGLVPACIAPYVIRRVGEKNAREFFLTGRRFDAAKALEIGLVNEVVETGELEETCRRLREEFLLCGPEAVKSCKELIARASTERIEDLKDYTARLIADLRASEEGREGIRAFFEKRKPSWHRE
jgi:methylglutaconyl-CoA hydratase